MSRRWSRLIPIAIVAMLASGCANDADSGPEPIELPAGDSRVEIFGSFSGEEATLFEQALADIETRTGVDITYTAAVNFTQEIADRIANGNLPDIALYPEPNLLMAQSGSMVAIDDIVNVDVLRDTLVPGMDALALSSSGKTFGLPVRANIKSVVWYSLEAFERNGYAVPRTEVQLTDLVKQIREDGGTPWCLGVESGSATGWVATDWVEDYVLRTGGSVEYGKWARGELGFNSELFRQAALKFKAVWDPKGNVSGGGAGAASRSFASAANGMFSSSPDCYLMKQGSFFTGFLPADVQDSIDTKVGVFPLPAAEGGTQGVVGRAELAAAFTKDADVQSVLQRLLSDGFGATWARAGGWFSPHTTFDGRKYPNETVRSIAAILYGAQVFVYDASDLMPLEVGGSAFPQAMTRWLTGEVSLDEAVTQIQTAWPAAP